MKVLLPSTRPRVILVCLLAATAGLGARTAHAHDFAFSEGLSAASGGISDASEVAQWSPVSAGRLDDMRGGFDLGNGLVASLGIDRAVYINGALVTSTKIDIPDIAHITTAQASALASATGATTVVQNGPGNSFDPSAFSHTVAATVVQNTLNNQNISTVTTMSISVNNLTMFRGLNLQQSLQSVAANPLGR
ncbi:hypothetical protein SAMN05216570_1774 [Dyella sp. OK004]|uniref:hypothetical protein n=1 Tax=Dyella sp. OK004 TaxID=1855292 RepID=UPI0008F40346|nr:hypothetical protein [Dyella sp. OK004]SFS03960.1 hypothetical protein SAMN05216570_1774 [Dyella sp. OK004]